MVARVVIPAAELDWKGEWNASAHYVTGDVVERLGSSYTALRASYDDDPVSAPSVWDLMAQRGAEGPPGPPGEAGPPGSTSAPETYIFNQPVGAEVWEIEHDLQSFPGVTVIDSGGSAIIPGDVVYESANKIVLYFSVPFGGVAYLN